MTKLNNKKEFILLRRSLRNNAPKAEKILWQKLKSSRLNGYKFRRQHGFDKYIVDFYCPQLKLAIEIDGTSHFYEKEEQKKDQNRQKIIESMGINFLRFTNTDIYENLNDVLNSITEVAYKLNKKK